MNFLRSILLLLLIFTFFSGSAQTSDREENQGKKVRILTWNIKMLPRLIVRTREGQIKRVRLIPEQVINDNIDLIVFQEAFDARARRILKRKLKETYPYIVGPANKQPWIKTNSGVMMFSKIPIKKLGQVVFKDCEGVDCYAFKGGLLVEADYKGKRFQVLGTHLEAGGPDSIKYNQYSELKCLLDPNTEQNIPQFLCGDFNTDSDNPRLYPKMLSTLEAEDGQIEGDLKFTADEVLCDMNVPKPGREPHRKVIDYILFKGNGYHPKSMKRYVRQYKHQWCDAHCDLSDHLAVLMEVEF